MNETTIERTYDYGKFKTVRGNRDVSRKHLDNLKKQIERENLLPWNPIVVNGNMEVIDGQHRLQAASELGLQVSYIVSPDGDIRDVMSMNTNSMQWKAQNYVNSYADRGFAQYVMLNRFCVEKGLPISTAMELLGGVTGGLAYATLKNGTFLSNQWDAAGKVADFITGLRPFVKPHVFTQRAFIRSARAFYLLEKPFPNGELVRKLEASGRTVEIEGSVKEYMRQYEDALNWKRQNANLIRLY